MREIGGKKTWPINPDRPRTCVAQVDPHARNTRINIVEYLAHSLGLQAYQLVPLSAKIKNAPQQRGTYALAIAASPDQKGRAIVGTGAVN